MDLSKVDLSKLKIEDLNLTPFFTNGKKLQGKFTDDGKPLIVLNLNDENDDDFKYLMVYDYDNKQRLINVETLYSWKWTLHGWYPQQTIKYKYMGDNPKPTQVNLSNGFWVSNQYDKNYNLIQSVTSEGATLVQQWDEDGYLMTKWFKIKTSELYHEYKYIFGINEKEFIQYEDSFGNFWDVSTDYPCPYENPVKIYEKGFLDDNQLYNVN